MNNIKYSFVLPAYKRQFIKEAIDSILAQTYTNFELIIVNDASPEGLDEIIKSYNDNRISYYINEKNLGGKNLVKQWNHSISYAKGDYIILASDDDIYHSEYLATMDVLVSKYPNTNVFRPRIQIIDGEGNYVRTESFMREHMTFPEFIYISSNEYLIGGIPYYLFKKEAIEKIGGFIDLPLAWGSDSATVLTLIGKNGIAASNEILFSFRMSGENISSKKNSSNILKQKILAIIKYHELRKCLLEKAYIKDSIEANYIASVKRRHVPSIKTCIYTLLKQSSMWACLKNIKTVSSIKILKSYWMILYIKRLLWMLARS